MSREQLRPLDILKLIKEINHLTPLIKVDIKEASDKEKEEDLKSFLFENLLIRTIAHYSVGDNKETVKTSLLETIPAFEEGFKWKGFKISYGGYDTMIWMVSLGVLCNIDLVDFKRITAIIKRDGAKDKLLDFIIHSKQADWPIQSDSYIQKYPYKSLNPDSLSNASQIKRYLDKDWYQGHSDAYWHGIHKNTKVNNFFGYWSWEAAAIAKIKAIDDSELKDQLYYPYDAVNW